MIRNFISVCSLLGVVLISSQAHADVFVPDGLNPGDEYHIVFVTSGTFGATSDEIDAYNFFVNAQAALNPVLTGTDMGVTYSAIGSTPTVDANVNALVEAPVYLLDSSLVATGFTDLWDGSINSAIDINQFGNPVGASFVSTGSSPDGTEFAQFGLGSPTGNTWVGFTPNTNNFWIAAKLGNQAPKRFYALSGTLTVGSVPEPSSIVALVGMGLIGVYRRRSRVV